MIFPAPQPILTTSLTGGVLAKSAGPGGGLLSSADVQGDAAGSGGFAERLEASEARTKSGANSAANTPGQAEEADALVPFPEARLSSFDERTSPSLSGGKVLPQSGDDLPPPNPALPLEAASDATPELAKGAARAGPGKVGASALTATSRARAGLEDGPSLSRSLERSDQDGLRELSARSPGEGSSSLTISIGAQPGTGATEPSSTLTQAARKSTAPNVDLEPGGVSAEEPLAKRTDPSSAWPEAERDLGVKKAASFDETAGSRAATVNKTVIETPRLPVKSAPRGLATPEIDWTKVPSARADGPGLADSARISAAPSTQPPVEDTDPRALSGTVEPAPVNLDGRNDGQAFLDGPAPAAFSGSTETKSEAPGSGSATGRELLAATTPSAIGEVAREPQLAARGASQFDEATNATNVAVEPGPRIEASQAVQAPASVSQTAAIEDSLASGASVTGPIKGLVTSTTFDPAGSPLVTSTPASPSASQPSAKRGPVVASPGKANPTPITLSTAPLPDAEPALPSSPSISVESALASQSAPSPIAQTSASIAAPLLASPPTTPNAATAPFSSSPSTGSTTAEILEQVTQQVSEAREAGRSVRPELTVRHSDFGTVAMRIEPGVTGAAGDWRASLSARDPGFVPAVQAALVERAVSAASDTASTQSGFSQGGGSQSGFQGGSSQRGSDSNPQSGLLQNGSGFGAPNGGSEQRYGSSTGSGQGSAQPYPGEENASGSSQTASVSGENDATPAKDGQAGSLFA